MRYHQTLLCSAAKWATVNPYYSTGHLPPGKGFSKHNKLYHGMSKGYVESISQTVQVIKVIV
jgi:hypothetical protein